MNSPAQLCVRGSRMSPCLLHPGGGLSAGAQGSLCPSPTALPTTLPVAGTLMTDTVALEGDPQGPDGVAGVGKGSSTPSGSGLSLGVPAPAHQQPLATDRSLSHRHPNESSFVVVLSFPASEEHTPPGGLVAGPGLRQARPAPTL